MAESKQTKCSSFGLI